MFITRKLLIAATALTIGMAASQEARVEADDGLTWEFVSIPGLPSGSAASRVWTDDPDNVYVWESRVLPGTTDVPEAFLYHWDGAAWTQALHLSGYSPGALFGTGPADIYASVSGCARATQTPCGPTEHLIYHYDGTAWTPQTLPAGTPGVYSLSGIPGHVIASAPYGHLLSNTGAGWSVVYTGPQIFNVLLLTPTEGYYTGCNTQGWWNGTVWQSAWGAQGCDMYDLWGMRDGSNVLHLYTVGNPTYSIGVSVNRYSVGAGNYARVFEDPSGFDGIGAGSAFGVWGSAANDVFVVGQRAGAGAVYQYDGASWQRLTDMGPIPVVSDVWGTAADDVWFTLADGRLLHLRPTDTTPPLISYTISGTLGANGWFTSDAAVDWTVTDPETPYTIDEGCVDTTLTTETAGVTLSCGATSEGGTASASLTVKIDRTAPVLDACPVAGPFVLGSGPHGVGPIGVEASLSGLDATASVLTGTVETLTAGTRTVTFTAVDNAGNAASRACGYQVIYNWAGFFEPVGNLPWLNQAKAGQAIPVKFSLAGNQGLAIFAAGSPSSRQVACESGAPVDEIEQTVNAGGSSLTYDPFSGQYIYVWKTAKEWAITCRQLSVVLADGTEHFANFRFK
jgi:hypothetical protein